MRIFKGFLVLIILVGISCGIFFFVKDYNKLHVVRGDISGDVVTMIQPQGSSLFKKSQLVVDNTNPITLGGQGYYMFYNNGSNALIAGDHERLYVDRNLKTYKTVVDNQDTLVAVEPYKDGFIEVYQTSANKFYYMYGGNKIYSKDQQIVRVVNRGEYFYAAELKNTGADHNKTMVFNKYDLNGKLVGSVNGEITYPNYSFDLQSMIVDNDNNIIFIANNKKYMITADDVLISSDIVSDVDLTKVNYLYNYQGIIYGFTDQCLFKLNDDNTITVLVDVSGLNKGKIVNPYFALNTDKPVLYYGVTTQDGANGSTLTQYYFDLEAMEVSEVKSTVNNPNGDGFSEYFYLNMLDK